VGGTVTWAARANELGIGGAIRRTFMRRYAGLRLLPP